MNKFCYRNCAYKDICKLSEENTMQCKVADDKDAQDFKRLTLFGIEIEGLLEMQYKNKESLGERHGTGNDQKEKGKNEQKLEEEKEVKK